MRYVWPLLTVAFVFVIFYNSSLDATASGHLSRELTAYIDPLARLVDYNTANLEHDIRKLAHFVEFAILGWLFCRTFDALRIEAVTSTGYTWFFGLFVATLDEYIQLSSAGRTGQVKDVLLDFSGVFCMWLMWRIWQWSKH